MLIMEKKSLGPAWACSIAVGVSFVLAGLFLFMDPLRDAKGDHEFWRTLGQGALFARLRFLSYGLGATCALGAVPAITRLSGAKGGWRDWAQNLGCLAFIVTAIDNFRLFELLPQIAGKYQAGDAAAQSAIAALRMSILLDPAAWLKFGALGAWILIVTRVASASGSLPKGLLGLGYALAFSSVVTVAALSLHIVPLIMFFAGLGGLLLVPTWFIWMGLRLRAGGGDEA